MKNYRIVKSNNGWNIERKLPYTLAKIVTGDNIPENGFYDIVANNIPDITEAEKRARNLAYSELEIGDVAIEF